MKKTSLIRFLLIVILFALNISRVCQGQKPVKFYIEFADSVIKKYFSSSVFPRVIADSYLGVIDDQGGMFSGLYPRDKDSTIIAKYVLLPYNLYDKRLDYRFGFLVRIDSATSLSFAEWIPKTIPECVRFNKPCHYIPKSKAVSLARKDSIIDPDNLLIELLKPERAKDFYWVVSSQKKYDIVYKGPEPVDGWKPMPKRSENTRCINARTGELISYDKFREMGPSFRAEKEDEDEDRKAKGLL